MDNLVSAIPRIFPGQIDAEMKRNPQFRHHMEGIRRCVAQREQIAAAFGAARVELAAHVTYEAAKGDAR